MKCNTFYTFVLSIKPKNVNNLIDYSFLNTASLLFIANNGEN